MANLLERRALKLLPLPLHVALVVAFGVAFGFVVAGRTMLRAAGIAALVASGYFARRVLAVRELLRLVAVGRPAARYRCPGVSV